MRPSSSTLATLLTLCLGSVSAIQTIYIGTINQYSDGLDYSVAWFSDSDPCQEATIHGPGLAGEDACFCDQDWSILGHDGITFCGCGEIDNYPLSVEDGGAPALTCENTDADSVACPAGSVNEGYVQPILYCT